MLNTTSIKVLQFIHSSDNSLCSLLLCFSIIFFFFFCRKKHIVRARPLVRWFSQNNLKHFQITFAPTLNQPEFRTPYTWHTQLIHWPWREFSWNILFFNCNTVKNVLRISHSTHIIIYRFPDILRLCDATNTTRFNFHVHLMFSLLYAWAWAPSKWFVHLMLAYEDPYPDNVKTV